MYPEVFGDYIIYVDESGDHSLVSIDQRFPLFALVFCVFRIERYVQDIVPVAQRLKFDFFGRDQTAMG